MPPIAAHRSGRLRLRPNRFGVIFAGMLVAMLAGAANYHSNLGLFLALLLGALALVSAVQTRRALRAIQVIGAQSDPVFAGEIALIRLWLTAAIPAVVTLGFAGARPARLLMAAGKNQAALAVATSTRGMFKPGLLEIATDYPLGLLGATLRLDVGLSGIVYPRPLAGLPIPETGPAQGPEWDKATVDTAAGVEDFKELRAYRPGDRLQHISWKGFSKGRGLLTKQFGGQAGTSVELDWDALVSGTVEQKLSRLCHEVLGQHRRQATYGLRLPGQVIAPGSGAAHKHNCLTALALYNGPARGAGDEP